jgi:hypothetical protein
MYDMFIRTERIDMFKMAVRVAYRIEGRCSRHRTYNPMKDEQGGIKGECPACYELLNAYRAYQAFREAIEKFETKVHPFIITKKARGGGVKDSRTSAPELSLPVARRRTPANGNSTALEANSETRQ